MIRSIFQKLYYLYCKIQFRSLGTNTRINPTAWISRKKNISIGHDSFIGKACHISIVKPSTLSIGNYVLISPYVKMFGGDHNFGMVGKRFITILEGGSNIPIVIEDDVMIGAEAIILKGIRIGEGAIVAAGAVVTKDIPPYTIWGGNPARKIGTRFTRDQLVQHLQLVGSNYKIDDLAEHFPAGS
jgi:acetyltransferase-like isoleucine patch superfamily enzyme